MLAALVVLAGCGGGGGGGGGSTVPVTSGPSTAPSPIPATPTPVPAPSFAVYPRYAELTGNQTFKTACAALNFSSGSPPAPQPATGFGDGFTLAYTAGSDSYALTGDGLSLSYGPAEIDPTAPAGARSYVRTEPSGFQQRFSIGQPAPGGVGLDYVRGFSLRAQRFGQTLQYLCVFGVPTLLSDPPSDANVVFSRVAVGGSAYVAPVAGGLQSYALINSTAAISVDVARGELRTTIRLIGNLLGPSGPAATTTDLGTYTAVATFDGTSQSYYGPLTSTDRQSQFSFLGGWFFGPQGREAAYAAQVLAVDPATGARVSAIMNVTAAR